MKRLKRLALVATVFIKKDWVEFRKPITVITGGLFLPIVMLALETHRPDLAKGMAAGVLLAGPFIYAQSCFYTERQHGTLEFLLGLPITPAELVLAKFASLFSMTLLTVNIPGLLLRDPLLLFYANAAALFLACLFMSATVISDKPWAPQLPLWIVLVVTLPFHRWIQPRWLFSHPILWASVSLTLIPAIISLSVFFFSRHSRH